MYYSRCFLTGCCGIKKSDRCFLLVYILLLLLVFLLEAKAGILAYIYREQAYQDLKSYLNRTFDENYGFDEGKTDAIDMLQREVQLRDLKCIKLRVTVERVLSIFEFLLNSNSVAGSFPMRTGDLPSGRLRGWPETTAFLIPVAKPRV